MWQSTKLLKLRNKLSRRGSKLAAGMAGFHDNSILDKASQKNGKLDKSSPLAQPPKQLFCPQCGSNKLYHDGFRYLADGTSIQRWLCRECSYRFSEKKPPQRNLDWRINTASTYLSKRQVCELLAEESKNLNSTTETKTVAEESGKRTTGRKEQLVKGKLVEFEFWMQKQNYAEQTIKTNRKVLRILSGRKADLLDPESVKATIARQKWSENRKRIAINAYNLFSKVHNIQWEKPKCHVTRKFPFIPNEEEIDALISGSGKKTATFLRLLKETAMRSGEAKRVQWTDIDQEKNIITLNLPEKKSEPRMWKVSQKLIGMLNTLPKESTRVFGESSLNSMKTTFIKARKRLAAKLQNPRLVKISFHTFRHWKATYEYHRTKDPYYVKQFLGHKSLKNTEIYINIERTLFEPTSDEFTVKVAQKPDEVKKLLEVGFDYVCEKDGLIFLRKRK
jgi:integrase